MTTALLITGTDTGVGKTLVGCALAAALSRRMRVAVLKPAETGCHELEGELVPEDALRLREAAECRASLDVVCPFRYAEPLAPWLAAERAGRPISLERVRRCFEELRAVSDVVIVEGAGGLLVPLTRERSFADLAADLGLPLLIVVGSRLGALNQTLLTIECARRRGLDVVGIVLNQMTPDEDLAQATNGAALEKLIGASSLLTLSFLPNAAELGRERLAAVGEPLRAAWFG
ncbi:MAG: dethiobiotin synthase [Candidatus Binatia bacterium]